MLRLFVHFWLFYAIVFALNPTDEETLRTMRDEIQGIQSLAGWKTGTGDMCQWTGITCEVGGNYVAKIVLSGRGLSGRLPAQLANLTKLSYLNFDHNNRNGPIPWQLGTLQLLWLL
eukprot:TRINITY_DN3549_c0_g2_i3.p1 TRINITY_DN3549_c0_g2~~TRINITY_DN3549_c0_g2_i3.p1  ORF type:complete len:136 (+),score=2.13 TRINITY_DN3549_c0_g2_i3:63-410(+)